MIFFLIKFINIRTGFFWFSIYNFELWITFSITSSSIHKDFPSISHLITDNELCARYTIYNTHFPLSKYTIWKLATASEVFQILQKYHDIKKIYISINNHLQNSFNKFLNFRNIHPKNKNPSKKVSSILLVFFNLEIPVGYTEVALRKTSQYNEFSPYAKTWKLWGS